MRDVRSHNRYRFVLTGTSLFLVLSLLLAACSNANTGAEPTPSPSASFAKEADVYLNQQVANQAFSGVVQVTVGNKVLFSRSYGMADWQQYRPAMLSTKLRIGSVTKQFTAMAILILQEESKLHVQDHLCTYIAHCLSA
jgi:CubicO group peptidase (beta-lactamase class C family)